MNHGEKMLAMSKELREMKEQQILSKIRSFSMSLGIFNGNYNELIYHLNHHNTPKVYFELKKEGQEFFDTYRKEIMRFLHNYIASAFSLIDHTRIHYRDLYSDNNLFPEYQDEVNKQFKTNPLAVFIKDFRQHIQHYQIPNFSSRLVYKKDAPDFQVAFLLPLESLKAFSGYTSLSNQFIKQQTDDIDVLKLINEYHILVEDFYVWFTEKQNDIHRGDTEKVNAHINNIRRLEITHLLENSIENIQSIEDFEQQVFRIFPDEDLELIKQCEITSDRVERILLLLSTLKEINADSRNAIKNIYNTA